MKLVNIGFGNLISANRMICTQRSVLLSTEIGAKKADEMLSYPREESRSVLSTEAVSRAASPTKSQR